MKNTTLIISLLFLTIGITQAQHQKAGSKINFYAQAGSTIFINSFTGNIEVFLTSSPEEKVSFYARAGYGIVSSYTLFCSKTTEVDGGIIAVSMLTGKKNHHFEVSAGAFLKNSIKKSRGDSFWCSYNSYYAPPIVLDIGYRYQKPEGGVIWRVNASTLGIVSVGLGISL